MKAKFIYILLIFKNYFSQENLFKNHYNAQILQQILIAIIIIAGIAIIIKIYTLIFYRKPEPPQKLYNMIFAWLLTVSLVGGFLLFSGWQQILFFSVNFWWFLLGLLFLTWGVIILIYRIKKYPKELAIAEDKKRKDKYLPKPKK